jgi:hypothetical protein
MRRQRIELTTAKGTTDLSVDYQTAVRHDVIVDLEKIGRL